MIIAGSIVVLCALLLIGLSVAAIVAMLAP